MGRAWKATGSCRAMARPGSRICTSPTRGSGNRPCGEHRRPRGGSALAMKPRITVLTLGVDELEALLRFYRDGLGLTTDGSRRREGSRRHRAALPLGLLTA